mgnify:CR=1 FL=1
MFIRKTKESDKNEIEKIHLAAFDGEHGQGVAKLTLDLLVDNTAEPILSLAAIENDQIVGHILFTKVSISNENVSAQILAPLAVRPDMQKKGIGTSLINEGLKQLKEFGVEIVFVLGHPEYYPRCGFIGKAESLGFKPSYPVPEKHADAWMVQELKEGLIGKIKGKVECSDALNHPEHWQE